MKNTFGNNVSVTLFGESHGEAIGAVIDGIAPGIEINPDYINRRLAMRRPAGKISTARVEADEFKILSGVQGNYTEGTPICIIIENKNTKSGDYSSLDNLARPGHADYTGYLKYHGFEDRRGGGHFSGRITAALTAAGAIAQYALESKGICIGTHILSCGGVSDRKFDNIENDIKMLNTLDFAVLSKGSGDKMTAEIEKAAAERDSVGGILETAVTGMPCGVGEPFFDSIESMLSHALFSVPAIKGVEFGDGFALAGMRGSEANDAFYCEDGKIYTKTNRNGGINGGISNGMPIIFRCAVKPTPSIMQKQDTVNFKDNKNCEITITGRHDPAIVHRARAVVDSVSALTLLDMLTGRFGGDFAGAKQ